MSSSHAGTPGRNSKGCDLARRTSFCPGAPRLTPRLSVSGRLSDASGPDETKPSKRSHAGSHGWIPSTSARSSEAGTRPRSRRRTGSRRRSKRRSRPSSPISSAGFYVPARPRMPPELRNARRLCRRGFLRSSPSPPTDPRRRRRAAGDGLPAGRRIAPASRSHARRLCPQRDSADGNPGEAILRRKPSICPPGRQKGADDLRRVRGAPGRPEAALAVPRWSVVLAPASAQRLRRPPLDLPCSPDPRPVERKEQPAAG